MNKSLIALAAVLVLGTATPALAYQLPSPITVSDAVTLGQNEVTFAVSSSIEGSFSTMFSVPLYGQVA
mgnify:CR=1 FL=1